MNPRNSNRDGNWLTRAMAWWRRQTPKKKLVLAAGVVALIIIGNLAKPEEPATSATGTPNTSAPPSATAATDPKPTESTPLRCNAKGSPSPAPDASGPLEHVTLGKLTCQFEHRKLDAAEVPVTVDNQGDGAATYTVTVHLLDASGGVVKTDEADVYNLDSGAQEDTNAILVGLGEAIESDGEGYWVRVADVDRVEEANPEPTPTGDTATGGSGNVDMPDVHPGAFCGTPGAKGIANGRVYTCRDGHWRR